MFFPVSSPRGGALRASQDPPGLLGQTVLRWLTHRATVVSAQSLTPRFRLITLRAAAFGQTDWANGDKVQVRAAGMSFRTYTPFRLDGDRDEVHLLGYVHGTATGAQWLSHAARGDTCDVMGPRRSVKLDGAPDSATFFGDETSMGLAVALGHAVHRLVFEANDPDEGRHALAAVAPGPASAARFIARTEGDSHLAQAETLLDEGVAAPLHHVLSGKASSIQRLRRHLVARGVQPARLVAKVYWAPGKKGLD